MRPVDPPEFHGVIAEFDTLAALVAAAEKARERGYRQMDAYTPMPSEALAHAMELPPSRLPLIVFLGGATGAVVGYGMQVYLNAVDYPLNVGGRPLHSWPYFIPITFELTILFAVLSAVFGLFALTRLPMPYHPVFNAPNFVMASRNKFFLCIETADPKFARDEVIGFFKEMEARDVVDVPR